MSSLQEALAKVGFNLKVEPATISAPMPECPEPELASVEKRPKWKKPAPIPVEVLIPSSDRILMVFRMRHGRVPTNFQRHLPEPGLKAPADGIHELNEVDIKISTEQFLSAYALNNAYVIERVIDGKKYDFLYLWFEPAGKFFGFNHFSEHYGEFLEEVFASKWNFLNSFNNGEFRSLNFVGERGPRHPQLIDLCFG